jgi:hypothetical protein
MSFEQASSVEAEMILIARSSRLEAKDLKSKKV